MKNKLLLGIIALFMLAFTLSNALGTLTTWEMPYGDVAKEEVPDTGNDFLLTKNSAVSGNGIESSQVLTGNFDSDLTTYEVLVHDSNTINIYNENLSVLKYNYSFIGTIDYSVTTYDIDSDGINEIFVFVSYPSSTDVIFLEFSASKLVQKQSTTISTKAYNKLPICYNAKCYFMDNKFNIYRYDIASNTIDVAISSGSSLDVARRDSGAFIDDCNPYVSGEELWVYGDLTGDGVQNDIGYVPLNSFSAVSKVIFEDFSCLGLGDFYIRQLTCVNNMLGVMMGGSDATTRFFCPLALNFTSPSTFDTKFNISRQNQQQYVVLPGIGYMYISQVFAQDHDSDSDDDLCYIANVDTTPADTYRIYYRCWDADAITGEYNVSTLALTSLPVLDPTPLNIQTWSWAYRGDFDDDSKDEFLFTNQLVQSEGSSSTAVTDVDPSAMTYGFLHGGGDCLQYYYVTLATNVYAHLSSSGNCNFTPSTPPTPPTPSTQVFLNETFTAGSFNLPETNCSEDSMTSASLQATSPVNLDNNWYCYVENKTASDVFYVDEATAKINTVSGLQTNHTGPTNEYDTIATFPSQIDMQTNDWIEFYCSVETADNDAYNYLVFSEEFFAGLPIALSLEDGGCTYNSTVVNGNLDTCVEISEVMGYDCDNTTKQYMKFQMGNVTDVCVDCGELNFQDIERIEIWRNKFLDNDTFYFDDLAIYREGIVANNSLPFIIFVSPIPDPQNVSEIVAWSISIGDAEDPSSAIWSAFDCGDDAIFDFNWGKRGVSPSFDCSYSSTGNYTGTAYASDDVHYPSLNDSMTNIVEILALVGLPAPVQGGNCIGFSAPSCTGTCYFFDDFSYNNPVECNDWSGSAKDVNPTSSLFSVFNLPSHKFEIELDGPDITNGVIYETQYEDYTVEFKIRLNHHSLVTFSILDNELDQFSAFLQFDNYNAIVYDPGPTTIRALTPNQWYKFEAEINLENDDIVWYVDDVLEHTGDFFDGPTDAQRKYSFLWQSVLAEFDVDYIDITYGTLQANATVPPVQLPAYVYDGSLFCAINWTANTSRFSIQNCADRGFSTSYPLMSLCVPRACVQDIGLGIVAWATRNIFTTIIIVTAFILIIPLLIALAKRK